MNKKSVLMAVVVVFLFCSVVYGQPWDGNGVDGDPYQIWTANDMQAIGANVNYWDAHFLLMADIDLSAYTGTSFNIIGNSANAFTGVFDGNNHTISGFTYDSNGIDCIGLFGYVSGQGTEIKSVRLISPNINGGTGYFISALVGRLEGGLTSNCCVNGGSIAGDDYCVGGLVGVNQGIIDRCYSSNNIAGERSVGGLVGSNSGLISNSYSNSSVIGTGDNVGGLAGWNTGQGVIRECYSTGIVSGQKDVGGLVGENTCTYIYGCFSIADTYGGDNTGGLVGLNTGSQGWINDSYAKGRVEGNESVGGLVGKNYYGTVMRSYSTGEVFGSSKVGGLIGYNILSTVASSFWDIETSGLSDMCGSQGTGASGCDNMNGKTTTEMQDPNTFTDTGWDFVGEYINGPSDVWTEPNGVGYPILWWQLDPLPPLPSFSGGTGEYNDPYLISTVGDINSIGYNPRLMDKHFVLVENIDIENKALWVIGNLIYPFVGVFDGNNHKISNFNLVTEDPNLMGLFKYTWDIGLFRYLDDDGFITNISLEDVNVDAGMYSNYVGALVGSKCGGTVTNCCITGTVSGERFVGGLIGNNTGMINNCSFQGTVIGTDDMIGGLVGANWEGEIYNSYTAGSVSGDWDIGGLAGQNGIFGTITNCFSTVNAEGSNYVGGCVGHNYWSSLMFNCYSSGSVTGTYRVGGTVGFNFKSSISNCYSSGEVTGVDQIGGLVGHNNGDLRRCYSVGEVTGVDDVGGLVGYNDYYYGDYTVSFWDSDVNPDVNGIGNVDEPNVVGVPTVLMQTESTYTDAGWDFVGETVNGTDDIWKMNCEGMSYPKLSWWEPALGDFMCPDGVNMVDFAVLGDAWMSAAGDLNWEAGCDISEPEDDVIDGLDLGVFVGNWLAGID